VCACVRVRVNNSRPVLTRFSIAFAINIVLKSSVLFTINFAS
jgi:hypothetical protein